MMLADESRRSDLLRIKRGMRSIGYHDKLLLSDYEYADVTQSSPSVRSIPLAGFAQSLPSYRDACIGVIVSNGLSGAAHVVQHRALGAPMIFEIGAETIDRWKITESGDPELKERISHEQIENAFIINESLWSPACILRAKAIHFDTEPVQLDFVDIGLMPALEGMIHKKLDRLLRDILASIVDFYRQHNRKKPDPEYLFRLVFRFIAAKVFRDRSFPGGWNSDDAVEVLKAVEYHYNAGSNDALTSVTYKRGIADHTWSLISSAFHFQNLSVDDLAFIYENTLITKETRKTLGTHSTPTNVAEYLIRKLPFQDLPESDRHVLEPCAGHGIFLISAMRRLRELLPSTMSDRQRHNYFVKRLVGIEIDTFAHEVCLLSLILADYPNPDGWQLHNEDVYGTTLLEKGLGRADVLLCNPPFEDFNPTERKQYGDRIQYLQKPAELLRRVLSKPPRLLGMVLPVRFIGTGAAYRDAHYKLANAYGKVEIIEMPEVFNYSAARTVLLLASDRKEENTQVVVTCRVVDKRAGLELFRRGEEPPATTDVKAVSQKGSKAFSLWQPRLSRIWSYMEEYPKLGSVTTIHQGIHWKGRSRKSKGHRTDVISDIEKPGYMKGFARVEGSLLQYGIKGQQYLSLLPKDQHDNAFKYPWKFPKAVCNAARLGGRSWRIGAVADSVGMAFSKQFFAFWPDKSISIYALAALLNSPVANAYSFDKDEERDNRIKTFRSLPIPPPEYLVSGRRIDMLSRELHYRIEERQKSSSRSATHSLMALLLQLDAAILQAYDLPPVLERELLDSFREVARPIPFVEFDGYYSEGFTAYIPLYELISEEFQEARADRLLARLTTVYDRKISEMLNWLNEE
ncbi:MAG: SAM-dependent methyltransferase [Blastocatellia bacterium]|nr:SAM-dependent methyltransferase [Blastocatellia bacterium]